MSIILGSYRCGLLYGLATFVCLTGFSVAPAHAQEDTIQSKVTAYGPEPTEEELANDPTKFSANVSLGYRSAAQYFYEPQESYVLRGRLSYLYKKMHLFSLDQGLAYRKFPYEELYATDTSLGYAYLDSLIAFAESSGLSLTPSAGIQLGTSKQSSARDDRYAITNLTLDLAWKAAPWLTLGATAGADAFFYKETISKYGEANERYSGSLGVYGAITYDIVSLSQSYMFNQTALDADWDDIYTFSASTNLSVSLPSDFTVSTGLVTSDNQLRYGRNNNFHMYDKDITRFTFSISKKFL